MPFLRFMHNKSKKSTAHSLRAYLDTDQGSQTILSFCRSLKRVSFAIFRKRNVLRIKGSMTLEAAFALPLFLFAVINILFAINIIGTQSRINAALHQTGNKMAFAGYVYERTVGSTLPDSLAGVTMTHIYMREGAFWNMWGGIIWNNPVLSVGAAAYHSRIPQLWMKGTLSTFRFPIELNRSPASWDLADSAYLSGITAGHGPDMM